MDTATSSKRARNSSSDTEDRVTQDRKRDKPGPMGDDNRPTMEPVFEGDSGIHVAEQPGDVRSRVPAGARGG